MDQKTQLTKVFLEKLNLATDQKNLTSWHNLWWHNPRKNGNHSMRLTDRGLEDFKEKLELKSYDVLFPEHIDGFTNQLILQLDKYIDGPYYLTRKGITVFKEKTAVQLILFGGDIRKFGYAKAKSQKNNTEIT